MKRKLKQMTRRNQGQSLEEIRDRLNPVIIGWVNYYVLADGRGHLARLDEWLRRRMRQIAWKQWKTPRNRYENLKARGVSEYLAIRTSGTSLGPWRLSKSPPVHHALNNAHWQQFGMESFLERYQFRHARPNRRKRTRMSGGVGGGRMPPQSRLCSRVQTEEVFRFLPQDGLHII